MPRSKETRHLASSTRAGRNVLALGAGLATGDLDAGEVPVRAGAGSAKVVVVGGAGLDGTGDGLESDIGDGNTSGWVACRAAIFIIFFLPHFPLAKPYSRVENIFCTYAQ